MANNMMATPVMAMEYRKLKKRILTCEEVEKWLGEDGIEDCIELFQAIANGDYTPENLKKDIIQSID